MKSNAITIIKKEFARFFGDRQLIFTALIMPGLLIYLIYSFMGTGIESMIQEGANDNVTLRVENMPESIAPMFDGADSLNINVLPSPFAQKDIDQLEDKNLNTVLMRFPADFDQQLVTYDPQSGLPAPNIEIYYNSTNNATQRVYTMLTAMLTTFEESICNRFDINNSGTSLNGKPFQTSLTTSLVCGTFSPKNSSPSPYSPSPVLKNPISTSRCFSFRNDSIYRIISFAAFMHYQ